MLRAMLPGCWGSRTWTWRFRCSPFCLGKRSSTVRSPWFRFAGCIRSFTGFPRRESLLRERTAKEVLHELGHTFGLVALLGTEVRDEPGHAHRIGRCQDRTILRSLRNATGAAICFERGNSMKKNWPILVVDDEDVMCESMGAWLREDGYHVDTAPNGQKALELAKSHGLRHLLCRSEDARRHGWHRDHDGDPPRSAGGVGHHHHRLCHGRHRHPGHEGRRAGIHREALQSAGDLDAGVAHPEAEEAAERECDSAQEAEAPISPPRHHHQESAHGRDSGVDQGRCQLCAARC